MKKKQFSKKLQLNKTTIANINESQMNDVKGGIVPTTDCVTEYNCTNEDVVCIIVPYTEDGVWGYCLTKR